MTAAQNLTIALAALITQITDLVDNAAALGQLSTLILTTSIYPNQQTWLDDNGYTSTEQLDGYTLISWEAAP